VKTNTKDKPRYVTKFSEEYFIPPSKKDNYLQKANDEFFT